MNRDSLIYVAGHKGLVGSAIVRALFAEGFRNLLLPEKDRLDLTRQAEVSDFFAENRPEFVFLAAAKVGGILANDTKPADFLRDNIVIQSNVIDAAYRSGTRKLLFLGSSCIYPALAPQPIPEDCLLSGALEPTNQWYAIAKIAGLKMCQAYRRQYGFNAISAMPTNLYGPGDNFNLTTSHVLPALIRRFHEARQSGDASVEIWGSGRPRREFLHVDDAAAACLFLMRNYDDEMWINVGWGKDIAIAELAGTVSRIVGFEGSVQFDAAKPDGVARKVLDVSRLASLGWRPIIGLEEGIRSTYAWFLENQATARM